MKVHVHNSAFDKTQLKSFTELHAGDIIELQHQGTVGRFVILYEVASEVLRKGEHAKMVLVIKPLGRVEISGSVFASQRFDTLTNSLFLRSTVHRIGKISDLNINWS